MIVQAVADIVVLGIRLKLLLLCLLEHQNGASLRRRILCLQEEEPELLWWHPLWH